MTTLTENQLARIRADIGDTSATPAFIDFEVQDAYDRTESVTDERIRQSATRGILIRQLIASAAKLNDYTAGATSEKRSQVFSQLQAMYKMYAPAVEVVEGVGVKPIVKAGIRSFPREGRAYPSDWTHDDADPR